MFCRTPKTVSAAHAEVEAKLIMPFSIAAHEILSRILEEETVRDEPQNLPDQFDLEQCNVGFGITGALQGCVIYGVSLVNADRVASKMIGTRIHTFDNIAASAIAEMCNMIITRALKILTDGGMACESTPAVMLRGSSCQFSMLAVPAALTIVHTGYGDLKIVTGLQKRISFALAS